jgi:hypothetical protein
VFAGNTDNATGPGAKPPGFIKGWRSRHNGLGRFVVRCSLKRREIAFGKPAFAGLEQAAQDLAAAGLRQRCGERDLLRRDDRAKPATKAFTDSPMSGSGRPMTPASLTAGCSISTLSISKGPMRWPAD